MRTFVKALAWAVMIAFWAWIIASYLEIINHNMAPGYIYNQFNFFELIF